MTRAAILRMPVEILATVLGLPEGARIEAVEHRLDCPDTVSIRVSGWGYEVAKGDLIPTASALAQESRHLNFTYDLEN